MNAILCSLLKYPNGDAGSIRQEKLAIMLRAIGYDVFVVGMGVCTQGRTQMENGIPYISLRYENDCRMRKIMGYVMYWKRLREILEKQKPELVLMDDIGVGRTLKLQKYCGKHSIPLVHDSVEWYSPEQFRHGKLSKGYIRKDLLNRYIINKQCKVIAISKFLQYYFLNKGIECVNIPVVLSHMDICKEKSTDKSVITFTYAGQPGKKDYLTVMIKAFSLMTDEQLSNVIFNIMGCTEKQIVASGVAQTVINRLRNQVKIYGRVPHEKVLEILKRSDFTLLMRSPTQRYAIAGFPSKIVESLSCGTPVICNLTSDLGEFLLDRYNALIVSEPSAEELCKKLVEAVKLSCEDRERMAQCALETAESRFLLQNYLEPLKWLLKHNIDEQCQR